MSNTLDNNCPLNCNRSEIALKEIVTVVSIQGNMITILKQQYSKFSCRCNNYRPKPSLNATCVSFPKFSTACCKRQIQLNVNGAVLECPLHEKLTSSTLKIAHLQKLDPPPKSPATYRVAGLFHAAKIPCFRGKFDLIHFIFVLTSTTQSMPFVGLF